MYENFGNFLLIIFTISKIDFTIKKPILGRKQESMASETTWESMASETTLYTKVVSLSIDSQVVSLSIDSRVVSLVIDSQIHVPFFRKNNPGNSVKIPPGKN